jgi:RND family efflux transporter MFP subunit
MNTNNTEKKATRKPTSARWLLWLLAFVAIAAAIGVFAFSRAKIGNPHASANNSQIYTVHRGELTISVTESGDIKPPNSVDITSKVEGETTIISIVDEGTFITQEDVNNGKILVELDASQIKQELMEEKIKFLDCEADRAAAKESVDIQKKQNESDIEAGRMAVRFGLMDLQKYLGESLAQGLIAGAKNSPNLQDQIASLVHDPNLGGEALQTLRALDSSIKLTQAKLARAEDKLEGTLELYDSNYVAEIELKSDELDVESLKIQKEQDITAKDLYVKYEFPKQVETFLSAYHESIRELDRIEAGARSKLAQAQAEFDKEKAKHTLQVDELKYAEQQLEACTIRAPVPGQVVYASSMMDRWERRRRMIEVGAEIDERQKIISIPDLSAMKAQIKIHETWVDKVQPNQKAKITIAAFPDRAFTGKVIKKAPLADPEEWLNPDLKTYTTDVSIDGTDESLKTGMTAKVEIIIDELKDILSVPIQSVINVEGKKVCFVSTSKGRQRREVETGAFNDNFVEIKTGLAEGEKVLLNPPRLAESEAG